MDLTKENDAFISYWSNMTLTLAVIRTAIRKMDGTEDRERSLAAS